MEFRSRITNYKTGFAGVLDAMIAGRYDLARARACLGLLQLDQTAIERILAGELSLEQTPLMAALASHQSPNVLDGESPFSRLLWIPVGRSVTGAPQRSGGLPHQAQKHIGKATPKPTKEDADEGLTWEMKRRAKAKAKATASAAAETGTVD